MAWGLIFVVVLMVLLFGVVVPAISNGYSNRNNGNRRYDSWRYDDRNTTYPQPRGGGCQQILILVVLVFLIFVGVVIYWSVAVEAGGGLF